MSQRKLDGQLLKEMVYSAARMLEQNRQTLDALNVFPVPDGDTGTNMGLTMISAVRELEAVDTTDVSAVAEVFARGSLKGARGNSGVILSQLIRGMSHGAKEYREMDGIAFVQAIKIGVETAYKAVMKPTEGTILTVARLSSEKAMADARRNPDLLATIDALIQHGEEALRQTPDLLPVLKQAGVVDAGGAGLMCIYRGFQQAISGEVREWDMSFAQAPKVSTPAAMLEGDIAFGYCTEFFIININPAVTETRLNKFRDYLVREGDSAVVVGDLSMLKVHVHSNAPGSMLQEALKLGELSGIKVDNMREQHRNLSDIVDVPENLKAVPPEVEQKPFGMVAVTTGAGISQIFDDLSVDQIVEGGQSMNPSIEDILFAIEAVPSQTVFVFPNNSNIIMAAQQAAEISEKHVVVIATSTIPQGLSAALALNPDKTLEENTERMNAAIASIKSGQVTYAVRDSSADGREIKEGDVLGMFNKHIAIVGDDINEVSKQLIAEMVDDESAMITVFQGQEVEDADAETLAKILANEYPTMDVELHNGGQPLYYYLFAVE